uniref:SET domain-containing protein n=1 Tax=Parascaris univalens TaxID=6257 RepID=A0A915AV65_PARUN
MEVFLDWLRQRGCSFAGVEVRMCDDDSGYGVFALRSFRINETLITLPPQLMITAGMIAELPYYKRILESSNEQLQPFEVLVMFFLIEQPSSSIWTPYLNVLPLTFSTPAATETTLNPDYLPLSIRTLWIDQQAELKNIFEKLCRIVVQQPSWERFLWAWHVVNTRCIFVESKPHPLIDNANGNTIAVIPLVDMLNHSNDNQAFALWDNVNKCYKVIAIRSITEGDQIFVCYGGHSNGRLWIEYGFTLANNIYNKVSITYDLLIALAKSVGLTFTDLHIQTMKQAGLPCTLYASDAVPSFGLKANLRILQLDFSELSNWSKIIYAEEEKSNNELITAVLRKLHEMSRKKMDNIPEKFHWLWNEQISLLEECIGNA